MNIIITERMILRTWCENDAQAFFAINSDPKVFEFLRGPLSMQEIRDYIKKFQRDQTQYGYCVWAAELKATGELMGFIGLNFVDWNAHFTPATEIGWRLGSQFWGSGLATEGAKAVLKYAFDELKFKEIVSFTVPMNIRSRRVMEKIGMYRDLNGDFMHPKLAADHRLAQHVLYRIQN